MAFELRIAPLAQRNIDEFSDYLTAYSEDFAADQAERLTQVLLGICASPLTWSYFLFTGAPYRAYLFRVGRQTQYWIIYEVIETTQSVEVLQFWNTRRDPDTLDL